MDHHMSNVSTVDALRGEIMALRSAGKSVAFVPTMGALHEGHLSLIRLGREVADVVVCSIFVNPTQFGEGEDLDAYPRTLAADLAALEGAQCDLVFTPTVEEMYPANFSTRVVVSGVSEGLCGAERPGHFEGMATVVAKLLMMVQPDKAIFGEKDFQQLMVVRRMVNDLNMPIEIIGAPTQRAADGLALSSRNEYLSTERRAIAPKLYEVLSDLAGELSNGGEAACLIAKAAGRLVDYGFEVEYIELRSAETLAPVERAGVEGSSRLIAAARLGATRLIDNVAV